MKSDSYYLSELEDKILETVWKATKDLPRPFGLILSGGFDSGLLAALTKPDYTFSISFPYGPKYDEGIYRDAIVKHLGLQNTIIEFKQEDFLSNLEEGVKILGETTTHFSLAPFNLLMKMVNHYGSEEGRKSVLSGEGPDEYLGGYARQIIFDELKKIKLIPELRNYKKVVERIIGNDLIKNYAVFMGYDYARVSEFRSKNAPKQYPMQGEIGKIDMEFGVIEKMEQKLADAHEVNLLYPYINEKFSEYCYQLPDHLKIRNGVTKWAFREICKKYLPEIMWNRAKMGGPVAPVNQWIKSEGGEFDKKTYIELQEHILKS